MNTTKIDIIAGVFVFSCGYLLGLCTLNKTKDAGWASTKFSLSKCACQHTTSEVSTQSVTPPVTPDITPPVTPRITPPVTPAIILTPIPTKVRSWANLIGS